MCLNILYWRALGFNVRISYLFLFSVRPTKLLNGIEDKPASEDFCHLSIYDEWTFPSLSFERKSSFIFKGVKSDFYIFSIFSMKFL